MFPCLSPRILPITFANTRKVPRAIHLLSLSHQSISPLSPRPYYSPPSLQRRRGKYAESQIAASVAGMTRRTRLVSLRRWSLVMSVAAVVGHVQIASYCYIELTQIGHPTCMDLDAVATLVRSYPWKCVECKTCEICQEKGDDVCGRSVPKFSLLTISTIGPYSLLRHLRQRLAYGLPESTPARFATRKVALSVVHT